MSTNNNFLFSCLTVFLLSFLSLRAEPAITELDLPLHAPLHYKSPTERFKAYYTYDYLLASLRGNGLSLEHRNFFEHIIVHEEEGFFGYHSSTQNFRIFQDIIRMLIEEHCEIEIKKNFHFFRIPGKPLYCHDAKSFKVAYPSVMDGIPHLQDQLVSLNFSLFNNFNWFGSCSIYYFTHNKSAFSVSLADSLSYLFITLGIPQEEIYSLFEIGRPLTEENNAVLFQFFDFSHHNSFKAPYQAVDKMCYNSVPGGHYAPSIVFADIYQGVHPTPFGAQFRLIMNTTTSLNPYSTFVIKRYERTPSHIVKEYEHNLREAIKALPVDPEKVRTYKTALQRAWSDANE